MTSQPQRYARRTEFGLTLIELLVSIVIMVGIAGVIATVFSIGIKAVSPSGPQARMLGAHDLSILEQSLGQDGARASCIQVPGGTRYGSCAKVTNAYCPPTASILCFAWSQFSDGTCHIAAYTVSPTITSSTNALRSEYSVGTPSPITSVQLARFVPVDLVVTTPPVLSTPPGESYSWVRALQVKITATVATNAPAQQLWLHPLATDPAGTNAGGTPC